MFELLLYPLNSFIKIKTQGQWPFNKLRKQKNIIFHCENETFFNVSVLIFTISTPQYVEHCIFIIDIPRKWKLRKKGILLQKHFFNFSSFAVAGDKEQDKLNGYIVFQVA